jgi:hypothetical protein
MACDVTYRPALKLPRFDVRRSKSAADIAATLSRRVFAALFTARLSVFAAAPMKGSYGKNDNFASERNLTALNVVLPGINAE